MDEHRVDKTELLGWKKVLKFYLLPCLYLYLFFLALIMMGSGFKGFKSSAQELLKIASNPFIALFIGLLATSLVQSSSTVTSLVVALCASGVLKLEQAIPVIMGANIGTSVTNSLVSLGYFRIRTEYARAASAATVHDFFNILAVGILLPLEVLLHPLRKLAGLLSDVFTGIGGLKLSNPIKLITTPVVEGVKAMFGGFGMEKTTVSVLLAVLGLLLMFCALILLTRALKAYLSHKIAVLFDKVLGKSGLLCILAGTLMTVAVQSSSITTSLLVPVAASGIVSLEQVFPITLGANIGTTVTALLASLATGNPIGMAAAFCHLFFNIIGVSLFFFVKPMQKIPLFLARRLGNAVSQKRYVLFLYVVVTFYVIPGIIIVLFHIFGG